MLWRWAGLLLSAVMLASCGMAAGNIAKAEKECLEGNAESCVTAGAAYEIGTFVTRDVAKAARLFSIAAQKGHPVAQTMYAEYFRSGEGVGHMDLRESYAWLMAAARKGHEDAKRKAEYLKTKLSPQELLESENRAEQLP